MDEVRNRRGLVGVATVVWTQHGDTRVFFAQERTADGAARRKKEHVEEMELCIVWKHLRKPTRERTGTLVARRRGATLQLRAARTDTRTNASSERSSHAWTREQERRG